MLYAAPAIGALLASVTSRWTPRVRRHGLAIALAAATWGVAIVVFGYCEHLGPAVLFLALAGGADGVSALFRSTLWNQTIPDALRGRLASIAGGAQAAASPRADVVSLRPNVARSRRSLERVAGLLESGTLRLPEISRFPLSQAAAAHRVSEARHLRGKLVLQVR